MTIKLVALDIDGTLLTSDGRVTPEVFEAIQEAKAQGVHVVLATGRPRSGVLHLLKELQLDQPGDLVITFNGGLIQDAHTGETLYEEQLSYEDYLDIEYLSRKLLVPMHAITKTGIYTANRNIGKYTIHESKLVQSDLFYRTPEEMEQHTILKCMYVDEPERLEELLPAIPADFYERFTIVRSAPFYLELLPKTVNKGFALLQLASKLNLSPDQVMAVGDQENDQAMLEVAGLPVAMENASPELKHFAKKITRSNDDSGVAYALRKWVLR